MAMASASRRVALSAMQGSSALKLSTSLRLPSRIQPCRYIAVLAPLGRLPLRTRSFATEAAAGEAPKRAPRKRTTKTSAKGKTTARKPKSKAKAKAKPKPKKKPLSPAQKELLKKRRQKDELVSLKEQALTLPYMKASSAYRLYIKQQLPTLEGTMPERVRKISEMWKNISPAELEVVNELLRANKLENENAHNAFIASHTPDQIRLANIARRRLQKLVKRSSRHVGRSTKKIVDPRQVKPPTGAYIVFSQERMNAGPFQGMAVKDAGRQIGAEWKALSPLEKKKYVDIAEADKARFLREYEQVYGHAPPSRGRL